ncbi:MAG TPA: radical SAM protein, partial [Longilinea sp.]|nr:radical SAM protein [Longilinea sp.]
MKANITSQSPAAFARSVQGWIPVPENRRTKLHVDADGRLVLPAPVSTALGLTPGADVPSELTDQGMAIDRSLDHLVRLYIEPTNACNLDCRTCMRNAWEEPLGMMDEVTFNQVIEGIKSFSPIPQVFFGGYGEPLTHPKILDMIRRTRELGAEIELITNGILLTPQISRSLIDLGVNTVWVSLDGITPESYADIRLGAELPIVLRNLDALHK